MMLHRNTLVLLGIILVLVVVACICILPTNKIIYSDGGAHATFVAKRNDYKSITSPLQVDVVEDVCLKLNIMTSSENCQSETPVYAPDFFDEIKIYFWDIPRKQRTYENVQDKLGKYLDHCEEPNRDGSYRCIYDLRGDHLYPVYFFFDKNGFYDRIIANWERVDF